MFTTKVYNSGLLPIVFRRDYRGLLTIQPRKFEKFTEMTAADIIKKFPSACSEDDYNKIMAERAKKNSKGKAKDE